ncbi:MAG: hypothetical protein ACOC6C_03685, partial [Verrucomicrobiota bacterium]
MPLSEFQKEILRTIAANRSPESYVAGATVIHQSKGSPRFSEDVDLFHDVEESVALTRISHRIPAASADSATARARIGKTPDCSM